MSVVEGLVPETWTPLRLLDWTTRRFETAGIDSPRLAAQVLLAHALSCDRVGLYLQYDKPLGPEELGRYRELVRRRLAGEPVAYLAMVCSAHASSYFTCLSSQSSRGRSGKA